MGALRVLRPGMIAVPPLVSISVRIRSESYPRSARKTFGPGASSIHHEVVALVIRDFAARDFSRKRQAYTVGSEVDFSREVGGVEENASPKRSLTGRF